MLKKNGPFEHRGDVVAFVKEIRGYTLLADAVDAMVEMLQWPKVSKHVSPPTAVMPRWAEDAETPQPVRKIELHRCMICGTRWLLWPDAVHGGGWNLLDKWQRPGLCCGNVAMGDQIEHLRDFELVMSPPTPEPSDGEIRRRLYEQRKDKAAKSTMSSPPPEPGERT